MTPPFDPLAPRATVAIALVGLLGCSDPRVDPSSGASPSSTTSLPREATPSSESTTPSPMAAQRSERARADETAALVTWLREQTISAAESRFLVGHDAERLRADQAALERLARRLEGPAGGVDAWTAALPERWRLLRPDAELEALYAAGLAFGNELYRPEPARLRATAAALAIPVEPALVHVCPDEPPRRRSAQPPPAYPCYSTMGCP